MPRFALNESYERFLKGERSIKSTANNFSQKQHVQGNKEGKAEYLKNTFFPNTLLHCFCLIAFVLTWPRSSRDQAC